MGMNDWDDETVLRRDRSARARRGADDYGDAPSRSSTRRREAYDDGARGARARSDERGEPRDRGDRYDRDPRSRSGRRDDAWGEDQATQRAPRGYTSSGAASSSRRPRPDDGYDDGARRSGRSVPARGGRDEYDDGSYDRRSGRDPRDPRYNRDGRTEYPDRGGRGAPAPRSMPRGGARGDETDGWNTPPRSRARPDMQDDRDPRDPRGRRPVDVPDGAMGGGLWGDGPVSGRRRALGGLGATRSSAAMGAAGAAAEAPAKRSLSFGRLLGILALALVLGVIVAYGYHKLTTPKIPASSTQPTTTPATTTPPTGTKTPSGTTTPHSLIPVVTLSTIAL